MKRTSVLAGIGGIAFAVLTLVALIMASSIGGNYKASDVSNYVARGHRAAVFVAAYLALVGIVGLICLLAHLRKSISVSGNEQEVVRSVFWGTGLAAVTCFAIGGSVSVAIPLAYAEGGSGFSISSTETFAIGQVGATIIFGAGGILLGVSLIVLALGARSTLPGWLHWLTLIVGVIGLASPAFFPWFLLLIWSFVIGIWLLVSARVSAPPALTDNQG